MNQWALATIAVLLIGLSLPLTIVASTLAARALFPQLDLWTAAALATILAPTDAADTSTSHLGFRCIIRAQTRQGVGCRHR
jgi:NhaP-type Na+/H+ or K+/H+ antiporter